MSREAWIEASPAAKSEADGGSLPPVQSGWSGLWSTAGLRNAFGNVLRTASAVGRQAPAIAAVTLALTFGSAGALAQTSGAPLEGAVVEAAVEAPTYTVRSGDELWRIADRFDTTTERLVELNDIPYPDLIMPGLVLRLPTEAKVETEPEVEASATHPTEADPQVDPVERYVVQDDDVLEDISRRVGVSVERIAELNDLSAPYTIRAGDVLQLRGENPPPPPPPPDPRTVAERTPAAVRHVALEPEGGLAVEFERGIDHLTPDDQKIFTETKPRLQWGMNGHNVEVLQAQLTRLGYPLGTADGDYGRLTRSAVRAFQALNGLRADGVVGEDTWDALASEVAVPLPVNGEFPDQMVYRPYTADAYRLFLRAAVEAGVPRTWAIADTLHQLLDAESDGEVGRPNYTYGARSRNPERWSEVHDELARGRISARSSATGLGQLLLSNVERHYPSGRDGINDPLEEAAGMLSYIEERHGTPDDAWRRYNSVHEGY